MSFDPAFYARLNPDVVAAGSDLFGHFMEWGWREDRDPRADFSCAYYRRAHGDELAGGNPFAHWVSQGASKGYRGHPWIEDPSLDVIGLMREAFDAEFYAERNPDVVTDECDAFAHFLAVGWSEGRDPNGAFSIEQYVQLYKDVGEVGLNPLLHYLVIGRREGRFAKSNDTAPLGSQRRRADDHDYNAIALQFDLAYYIEGLPRRETAPGDPVRHYLDIGWRDGRDPCRWFSTEAYLKDNPDVQAAGVNPFVHFVNQGLREGRRPRPPASPAGSAAAFAEHARFTQAGPLAEEVDRAIARLRPPRVKALAFYLPQFHAIPENDAWWGAGFTEWRNVVRGQPRFRDHYQPRTPRELGFYDLSDVEVIRRQCALAKTGGVHGFCFYYYAFNGRRLLETPVEALLNAPDIEMPFVLMWANENWTRTWDGLESDILMRQDYRPEDEEGLIADIARHFKDPRYIRIGGRPLYMIYRPGIIPDAASTIARWRLRFRSSHDEDPLLFMAQGFGDLDPRVYGLDGAIEFPPHKVAADLPPLNGSIGTFDPDYAGHVVAYDDMARKSLAEPETDYPLIRGVTPSWDNSARRPGRGMVLQGSTPSAYEAWLRKLVDKAIDRPVFDESFVAINAWNEWAEGAYLEPDVHFGAAYLNATARALGGAPRPVRDGRCKLLIVGHDAYPHGAQMLVAHMASTIARRFGVEVHILVCGDGPLMARYREIGECTRVECGDYETLKRVCEELARRGFARAIVNSTVSGWTTPALRGAGFATVSLIHELASLIKAYAIESRAASIAASADAIVFPAEPVRDAFLGLAGGARGEVVIRPQGLYRSDIGEATRAKSSVRKALGLGEHAIVVINVGYADSRKGFDIFAQVAKSVCARDRNACFVWVGDATDDVRHWFLPDATSGHMAGRLILTGLVSNVEEYYAAADLFLLTSREDPFPSVVIEAMAAGLPVVGFAGSGGCVDLIERYGRLVPRADAEAAAAAIAELLAAPAAERRRAAAERSRMVRETFRFDDYCASLMQLFEPGFAKVSVVVPNYNYARYLSDRLTTIFRQTYPVFEIIVLDDASTDDSVATAQAVAGDARRDIEIVANSRNSGSVFRQWRKGAVLARGDYVWIAEADDLADERFLETLVSAAQRTKAALAFSDSWQIGPDGERLGESYKPYLNAIEPEAFSASFASSGRDFLRRFLSVKNVLLNASGVLWRREALSEALQSVGDQLYDYAVAGDWRLYADVCAMGGSVAYVAQPLNGHRRHATSVTHALGRERHYNEILAMQDYAASLAELSERQNVARAEHRRDARRALGIPDDLDAEIVPFPMSATTRSAD